MRIKSRKALPLGRKDLRMQLLPQMSQSFLLCDPESRNRVFAWSDFRQALATEFAVVALPMKTEQRRSVAGC